MWSVERPDGGRGFGFTGGHFHKNWGNADFRRTILNALLWVTKMDVPAAGVDSKLSAEDLGQNLDPKPAPKPKKAAGLPTHFSPHSFRVTTVTDLLEQNVPLEDVQYLAGHSDPRTTRIYDRRRRKVTRNIVERISI